MRWRALGDPDISDEMGVRSLRRRRLDPSQRVLRRRSYEAGAHYIEKDAVMLAVLPLRQHRDPARRYRLRRPARELAQDRIRYEIGFSRQ
jgi:hypothetical protein